MSTDTQAILEMALRLPEDERVELTEKLVESLDSSPSHELRSDTAKKEFVTSAHEGFGTWFCSRSLTTCM